MFATHLLLFCRIALALIFAVSALGKARDVAAFREAIADFKLLPAGLVSAAAWGFLVGEVAVVLLMLAGGALLGLGFVLAIVLLALFAVALLLVLQRRIKVTCNCFGRSEQHVSPYDVLRNLLLIGCSLLGLALVAETGATINSAEVVLIALMAAAFTLCVTNLADIAETLRQPFHIN
ncbi:MAG: hypothetical protein JOZ51_23185 [Chloroflexi bacterium]|nr:hypothetical protein [Chloroflexota bacterium]